MNYQRGVVSSVLRPVTKPALGSVFDASVGGGSAPAWEQALPALREYILANYNQPNPHNRGAMALPPTVTVHDANPMPGLTKLYTADANPEVFSFGGGRVVPWAGTFRRFPSAFVRIGGGLIDGDYNGTSHRVGFVTDAQNVSISVSDSGSNRRFLVGNSDLTDLQYVSLEGTPPAGTGGRCYYTLGFSDSQTRLIIYEGEQSEGFERIAVLPTDSVAAPSVGRRAIFVGDSFTSASGATRKGDGYGRVASDNLFGGKVDAWLSGVGGTGYVASGAVPDSATALPGRLADINSTGPWDVIVVAMGFNDFTQPPSAVASEAAACFASIRAANPAAQIIVVGPWDSSAPSGPSAGYAETKAAIISAIPVGGFYFIDPQGVVYSKSDPVHPDTAGHKTLGDWLALQIKTALDA